MSVCLSVRSYISKGTCPIFTKLSIHATCGRGSVLIGRQCNTLCTSGFVDDITFSENSTNDNITPCLYVSLSSPGGGTGAKFDVYDCFVVIKVFIHTYILIKRQKS